MKKNDTNAMIKEMFNEYKKEQRNKFKKFVIFVVVFCIVISGITGVASYSLAASEVNFSPRDVSWNVDNAEAAINDLYYKVPGVPTGTILPFMGTTAPKGYVICDGTEYNISSHINLANFIKKQFGSYDYFGGDGETTFKVPDLRGEFLRGSGTNSHANQGSGANVGQHTNEGLPNITASLDDMYSQSARGAFSKTNLGWHPAGPGGAGSYNGTLTFNATNSNPIYGNSDHVTPTNTSVLYIIKY